MSLAKGESMMSVGTSSSTKNDGRHLLERHSKLLARSRRLLDQNEAARALAAATSASEHAEEDGRLVAEAELHRSQALVGLRRFDEARDACTRGLAVCPLACATYVELKVAAATLTSFTTDQYTRTRLACRRPMSHSPPKQLRVDNFLNELPLAQRAIYKGGASLVSETGFPNRRHDPEWCSKNATPIVRVALPPW